MSYKKKMGLMALLLTVLLCLILILFHRYCSIYEILPGENMGEFKVLEQQESLLRDYSEGGETPKEQPSRGMNPKETILKENLHSLDLRGKSVHSEGELEIIVSGTGLEGLGDTFFQAQETYGVNADFLIALCVVESGWGTSSLSDSKNNLGGYGAYQSSPSSAIAFDSKSDCIMEIARCISQEYLNSSGRFYSGGYTVNHVNTRYASDTNWSNKVISIMRGLDSRLTGGTDG